MTDDFSAPFCVPSRPLATLIDRIEFRKRLNLAARARVLDCFPRGHAVVDSALPDRVNEWHVGIIQISPRKIFPVARSDNCSASSEGRSWASTFSAHGMIGPLLLHRIDIKDAAAVGDVHAQQQFMVPHAHAVKALFAVHTL